MNPTPDDLASLRRELVQALKTDDASRLALLRNQRRKLVDSWGGLLLTLAVFDNSLSCIRAMLDWGMPPDLPNPDGSLASMKAAQMGHARALRLLLDRGADPNAKDPDGRFPLLFAAAENSLACLDLLLIRGANPNLALGDGISAAMLAAQSGHADCVRLLIERGADADARSCQGLSCGDLGVIQNHVAVLQVLADAGADLASCQPRPGSACEAFLRSHAERLAIERDTPASRASTPSARL